MADSIKVFENSLRDYLINAHSDSYNTAVKIQYRYNNLKVFMEPKREKTPHFKVSVGISEACFSIEPIERMSGSLVADDIYVIRWAARPNINGELKKHWTFLTNQKVIKRNVHEDLEDEESGNKKDQKQPIPEDDNFMPEVRGPKVQVRPSDRDASDYVTGTGINKTKYSYEERRKMEQKFKKPES